MTKVTEWSIRRIIAALRKEGVEVNAVTVRTDGSVTVHKSLETPLAPAESADVDRWLKENNALHTEKA